MASESRSRITLVVSDEIGAHHGDGSQRAGHTRWTDDGVIESGCAATGVDCGFLCCFEIELRVKRRKPSFDRLFMAPGGRDALGIVR